jgi:uncharacterized protein YkwD
MSLATLPKPKTYAKKRQAQHHRHSKEYLKSYWPYLPMLLIVGLGLMVNSAWSKNSVLGAKSDFSSSSLLSDTNAERAKDNEPVLTLNPQLASAAQAKAEDMVKANYWAHNSPDGKTPWSFISASGYQYQTAGENLAYGFVSAEDSVAGWMNSPEHRANILDGAYRDVGFGVASSPNYQGQGPETVVVAEYGQPLAAAPAATTQASNVLGASSEIAAQPVSRVQVLAGSQYTWSLVAVIGLTMATMTLFMLRHGYRLHRLLNRGEIFIVHHPYFDIAIVFVITAGVILTRTSGIIR